MDRLVGNQIQQNQKPGLAGRASFGLAWFRPSGRGPLTTLRGDGLSHLADQEGLEIWLVAGPFQADNGVPRLDAGFGRAWRQSCRPEPIKTRVLGNRGDVTLEGRGQRAARE